MNEPRSAHRSRLLLLLVGALVAAFPAPAALAQTEAASDALRIRPYPANPYYWQYRGEPVVLLGGSDDDNLFQWDEGQLRAHLDRLAAAGGNVVRNTMSARDEGNVQPFAWAADGRYDLGRWEPEYWDRLDRFLRLTHERGIVVQIEVWAFHDFFSGWEQNAWNPKNAAAYSAAESGLSPESYGSYWEAVHEFFLTVPAVDSNAVLLPIQQRFVDELLSHTLPYDHVLYCMTNEIFTQYPPEWGWYWARYIDARAAERGMAVEVAEMFQNHDLDHAQHRATLDHPEIYDFIDVSQNSRKRDQEHWDKLQWVRAYVADAPRPINHTKTYGGDAVEWTDGDAHGVERFWRNVIGGAASTRFHRPPAGIGLNDEAEAHVRSARMLADAFDLFRATPDVDSERLAERAPDEAYLSAIDGEAYAVYFPDGGAVRLDLRDAEGAFVVRWLEAATSAWRPAAGAEGGRWVPLEAPGPGAWVAVVERATP